MTSPKLKRSKRTPIGPGQQPAAPPRAKRHREADAKGAVESEMEKIDAIDAMEALGYQSEGHEEHTGEKRLSHTEHDFDLADNRPEDL